MDGVMTTLPHHEPGSFSSRNPKNRISSWNTKWIQQNMTDVDAKVKAVVKLIEEDASSFNRKAEMYFTKRPQLMKLIEELYRAYRALAERYDYMNGELEWAHRTMTKAYSTHFLFKMMEDFPSRSPAYPQISLIPETACIENHSNDPNEEKIQDIKKELITIHGEKDDILRKYQETMKELSEELNSAYLSSKVASEQASEAKTEAQRLQEAIVKVEVERDVAFLHEKELTGRISTLERRISQVREEGPGEGDPRDEIRSKCLQNKISRLESQKETIVVQSKSCLEKIADLEKRANCAENEAGLLHQKAHRSEKEVEKLKNDLDQIKKEKKSVAIEYDHRLLKMSNLESELSSAEDEKRRISSEVLIETDKLMSAEVRYATLEISNSYLQSEARNLELTFVMKEKELWTKHEELEKLVAQVQEEQLRFEEIEVATLALQEFQSQEENGSLQTEIREMVQILKEFGVSKDGLEKREENTPSVEELQNGVLQFTDIKKKLEEEVVVQKGLAKTLENHICVLKDDIKNLKERYTSLMERIKSAGLNPECVGSSIKNLKDENSKLRQIYKENKEVNEALMNKWESMEQFSNKNKFMQKSIEWLNKDKLDLTSEKEALLFQLQTITNCVETLNDNNTILENPLYGADIEIESFKEKSDNLEELPGSVDNERSILVDDRSKLIVSLDNIKERLKSLENQFSEAESKCVIMEKEREYTFAEVKDVKVSLGVQNRQRTSLEMLSEARLASLEKSLHFLQQETKWSKMEFEEELSRAMNAHFEIFILHISMQDLESKNHFLSTECEKHIEATKSRENLVRELEKENLEQLVEIELFISEIEKLRADVFSVFKALGCSAGNGLDGKITSEFMYVHHIIQNIEGLKSTLLSYEDDKYKLLVENSIILILLNQLSLEGTGIMKDREILKEEFENVSKKLMLVQKEKHELIEVNEQLKLGMKKEKKNSEKLGAEIGKVCARQRDIERDYVNLKEEHCQALEDRSCLMKININLNKEKSALEEENNFILAETLVLDNHCTVFKNFGTEKDMKIDSVSEDLQSLQITNGNLEKEVGLLKKRIEMEEMEKLSLKDSLKKMEKEIHEVKDLNNHLRLGISDEMKVICQKEMEICLAEEKLKLTEDLNLELYKTLDELKKKLKETKIMKENVEKDVFELSEENNNQSKEIIFLRKVNAKLSSEIAEKRNVFADLNDHLTNGFSAQTVTLCQKDIEVSLSEEELKSKHEETILMKERLEKEITEITKENEIKSMEIHYLRETNRSLSSGLKELKKESEVWEAEASTFHFYLHVSKAYEVVLENKVRELSSVCETLGNESALKSVEMEKMKEKANFMETEISFLKAQLSSYAPKIDAISENMVLLEYNVLGKPATKGDQNNELKDVMEPQKQVEERMSSTHNRIEELYDLQKRIKSLDKVVKEKKRKVRTWRNSSIELEPTEEQEVEPTDIETNGELFDTLGFQKSITELLLHSHELRQRGKEFHSPLQEEIESSVDKTEVPTSTRESNLDHNQTKIMEIISNVKQLENLQKTVEVLKSKLEGNKKRKMNRVDIELMKKQLNEVEETLVHMSEVNGPVKISPGGDSSNSSMTTLAKVESDKTEQLHLEVQLIQNMFSKLENGKKPRGKTWILKRTSIIVKCFFHIWRKSRRTRSGKGMFRCCRPSGNSSMVSNIR